MENTLKEWLKRLKLHESTISMILGALVVIVVAILLFNYFVASPGVVEEVPEEAGEAYKFELIEEEEGKLVPQGLPVEHVVTSGEHLWRISQKYYGNGYNWMDISKANNLSDPGLLLVDQKLTIPRVALRVKTDLVVSETTESTAGIISGGMYTVVRGDNLWSIAVRAYQDGYEWQKIFEANRNNLSDPNLIEVGMELALPR